MSQDQICAHERMLDVHDYCPDCGELRTSWLLEGAKLRARIAELEASNAALRGAMRTEWKDLLARAERAEADAEIGRKWRADSSLETWFPYTAEELTRLRAELAAALADAERYRELRRLTTTWPTTVLVVNYNIGHTWHTADAPDEIDGVLDDAIAARGAT